MPVRARDLRTNIKEYGFEKGVVQTMEQLLDEFAAHRQYLAELREIVDKTIDQMNVFVKLGEGLQTRVDELKRLQQGDANGESS
ncbi:MAG TPA: hypothetical protein VGN34_12850 [Ktedonobacteraceae bacterium]|jgi:hypothetical protein